MPSTHLFYIYDPMCSWCYAFNSSLTALLKILPPSIHISYLLGGLAEDTEKPMPIDLQETIQQAWQRIENTVPGILFNYDFWKLNTPFRSTYPACRAILAARKQGSYFETKMLIAIQKAYYQDAKNPSLENILQECASEIELDPVMFIKDLTSSAVENELQSEITLARKMLISSYPSLCLLHKEQKFIIPVDYVNYQTMVDKINNILKGFSK